MSLVHAFSNPNYSPPVAGVDEAGRGPWAGPVMAAAVVWKANAVIHPAIHDSKKLSAKLRATLFEEIQQHADFCVAQASVEEIDSMNILAATMLAMTRAIEGLPTKAQHAVIDGNRLPKGLACTAEFIIQGDAKISEIAAASILAKVTRDRYMAHLNNTFPHYGWDSNAGYGTATHIRGLEHHGVTPHHRRSYKPIQAFLKASA